MKISEAQKITGGLSNPGKMPGAGYSLPATSCRAGSKLREIPGTVCSECYAMKGRYLFNTVQEALKKRLCSLKHPQWAEAMATLINSRAAASRQRGEKVYYFRWHDSGDLQGYSHLENIIRVCKQTPGVRHWLPTRELGTVKEYLGNGGSIPGNLLIRYTLPYVDQEAKDQARYLVHTAGVVSDPNKASCPAPVQGGKCGRCRMCWGGSVGHVDYLRH